MQIFLVSFAKITLSHDFRNPEILKLFYNPKMLAEMAKIDLVILF